MKVVEWNVETPEEQLALDELLLKKAEAGEIGETLRFWSSKGFFVVLGRGKSVQKDCFADRCVRDGVGILRRISGGGTVLQGPGCLNYSAVLPYGKDEAYRDIRTSYRRILGRISDAFRAEGFNVEFFPVSDLALEKRKVSGNAQARKRKYFLHHGTVLYDFDLEKVSRYLKHPRKGPEYRESRPHEDFLANIPVSEEKLEELVKSVFPSTGDGWRPEEKDREDLGRLVSQKYTADWWNFAF